VIRQKGELSEMKSNLDKVSSVLQMNNMFFKKKSFDMPDEYFTNKERRLEYDFARKIETRENGRYDVCLSMILYLFNTKFIEIELVADFEYDSGVPNSMDTPEIVKRNAIAIMFPYLRSELTLLTTMPNFQPIIMPPLNINKLLDELEAEA